MPGLSVPVTLTRAPIEHVEPGLAHVQRGAQRPAQRRRRERRRRRDDVNRGERSGMRCAGGAGTYIDVNLLVVLPTGLAVGLTAGRHAKGRASTGRYVHISGRFAPSGPSSRAGGGFPRSPPWTAATQQSRTIVRKPRGPRTRSFCDERHTKTGARKVHLQGLSAKLARQPGIRYRSMRRIEASSSSLFTSAKSRPFGRLFVYVGSDAVCSPVGTRPLGRLRAREAGRGGYCACKSVSWGRRQDRKKAG